MTDRFEHYRSLLPPSYVVFMESQDGWEGDLGGKLGYTIVWCREALQVNWHDYEMAEYLSERWFPFGSNGGGEMLCFDLQSGNESVYFIPYIGMADEAAMLHCDSFTEVIKAIHAGTSR